MPSAAARAFAARSTASFFSASSLARSRIFGVATQITCSLAYHTACP